MSKIQKWALGIVGGLVAVLAVAVLLMGFLPIPDDVPRPPPARRLRAAAACAFRAGYGVLANSIARAQIADTFGLSHWAQVSALTPAWGSGIFDGSLVARPTAAKGHER